MSTNDRYPIHTGFLTKSPPETRVTGNFKRWMRRWFVLWEDKSLQYFKERGDMKPKKTIDLSHCEFLDTNLSDKRFKNIFCIRISGESERDGRTFYLAADSPYEMKSWVDIICKLCDFKAIENNNNSDATIRHQIQAPLDQDVSMKDGARERDSGILEPDTDTGDLVPVKLVNTESTCTSAYDFVPPPRPSKNEENNHNDLTSPNSLSPKTRAGQRDSCPLDTSSSSGGSLSSIKRSSGGSDVHHNYDVSEPTYAVPPLGQNASCEQTYDVPPEQTYAYPQKIKSISNGSNYDVLPVRNENRYSDGSNSDNGNEIYDVPPTSAISTYDYVPPPVSANPSSTMFGMTSQTRVGSHCTLPSARQGLQSVYDVVPSRDDNSKSRPESYDFSPSNYDYVPPPKAKCGVSEDNAPPVYREVKPSVQIQPYVNLPPTCIKKKQSPNTCPEMQRDSGAILDEDEALYDVPPVVPSGPSVNRRNKPNTPPTVDRTSKPTVDRTSKPTVDRTSKVRDYVNIAPTRSATVRENSVPRRVGNVQRSKSAAANFESEGYLYMESPKRTESSTRYSKKDRKPSIVEETEDEVYEYMSLQRNENQSSYENSDDLKPITPKNELSPERTAPLSGHYQDICVVCQSDPPSIPRRIPTQYTTIDLEKTRGLRKTCEDLGKAQ